jgi:subtilisin family serine protease
MVQAAANGSVVVALIDTGCDVTNEDLNVVGGMDFTSDNSYGLDGNGHGTHVAGGVAAAACRRAGVWVLALKLWQGVCIHEVQGYLP